MRQDIKPFLRAGLTAANFQTEHFQKLVANREALVHALAETFADKLTLNLVEALGHVTTAYDAPRFLGPRSIAKYKLRAELIFHDAAERSEEGRCNLVWQPQTQRFRVASSTFISLADKQAERERQQAKQNWQKRVENAFNRAKTLLQTHGTDFKISWAATEDLCFLRWEVCRANPYFVYVGAYHICALIDLWHTMKQTPHEFLGRQLGHPNPYAVYCAVAVLVRRRPGLTETDLPAFLMRRQEPLITRLGSRLVELPLSDHIAICLRDDR